MTNEEISANQDWVIPAVLVAIVVFVALVIGITVGVRAAGNDDDSVAGQLEQWSSCLRSNGANVPLVESLRDGGFRITVDGSLVDDGLDMDAIGPALERCEDDAPEAVQRFVSLIDGFSSLPFSDFGLHEFGVGEAIGP